MSITLSDSEADYLIDVLDSVTSAAPPNRRTANLLKTLKDRRDPTFFPFPEPLHRQADTVLRRTAELYEYNANERGKGDGWAAEPPRWHYWKAADELFTANHHTKSLEEYRVIRDRVADSFNHQLMALALYQREG